MPLWTTHSPPPSPVNYTEGWNLLSNLFKINAVGMVFPYGEMASGSMFFFGETTLQKGVGPRCYCNSSFNILSHNNGSVENGELFER